MAKAQRAMHPDFLEYMNYIVAHPNYADLPAKRNASGDITWVVSGNSANGQLRDDWWFAKVQQLGVQQKSDVARAVHPTELNGLKPCQICGRKMYVTYVYPNVNTLKSIKKSFDVEYSLFGDTILEVADDLYAQFGDAVFPKLRQIFGVPRSTEDDVDAFTNYITTSCLTRLSPGVMSNAPDRLDGFHTYNACCRGEQDTGRHKANLATYTQDRRAYEHWSDGDFNQSNRLMGEYHKHAASYPCPNGCGNTAKMTADHIGPISLGFAHRPKFNALCNSCNSTKNNRMSLSDVQQLIQDEQAGEQVVSWHSKPIWDALKDLVESNQDAVKLSRLMATNMQQVLPILAEVYEQTGSEYLTRYLKPEYAFQDHRFTGFHPLEPEKLVTLTRPLDSKNKQKNAERYVRISFEELERFTSKTNRRVKSSTSGEVEREVSQVVAAVRAGLNEDADSHLLRALTILAEQAKHSW